MDRRSNGSTRGLDLASLAVTAGTVHHRRTSSNMGMSLKNFSFPLYKENPVDPETATAAECWRHVQEGTMPLFVGEGLKVKVEWLNAMVNHMIDIKQHADIVSDLRALLATGMAPLRDKLSTLSDDKLVNRMVEVWLFFYGSLLPYLLGIFEPLQLGDRVDLSSQLEIADLVNPSYVRDLIISSFRKEVVASQLDRLKVAIDALCSEPRPGRRNISTLLTLLQIVSIVNLPIRDDDQRKLDALGATLKTTYVKWSRVLSSSQSQDMH